MKKLILILFLIAVAYGATAMGYPQSSFAQQKALTSQVTLQPKLAKLDLMVKGLDLPEAKPIPEPSFSVLEWLVDRIGAFIFSLL